MSRSLGVSSLTTFPPIRNVPEVMSSSPATIRSAVVFPHPDGPTSTMNSPSATSSEKSFTAWKPFSYTLLIFSMSTVAIMPPYRGYLHISQLPCWPGPLPGRRRLSHRAHPFTAPEVRPEITNLRKMKTRMPIGTTATTLAAKIVPYGTVNTVPNSAMPTGMVR